jgi:hypothetical protein
LSTPFVNAFCQRLSDEYESSRAMIGATMDSERLLQGLLVIVDYGGLVERLAALRLLARVPWPEEAEARADQMISELSPESAGVVYAKNFLPPRALRPSVIQLVESAPIDLRRVIQIYRSARSDLNDRLDQPIDELSDDLAEQLLLGRYAWLLRPELDEVDPDARQGEGNYITGIAERVRHRHIPRRSEPLFDIYLALFPRAFRFWINWLEKYEDQYLPNSIPTYAGHLSASWQIAWAASANSVDEILDLVPDVLVSENALARLAILHFAELTLRYAKSEWMPLFGGGSMGSMGSTGSGFELDEFDGGSRVSAEEPAVSEVESEEAPPWAATEAAAPAEEPKSPEVYHTLEEPKPVGPPMLVILPPFPLAGAPPSPGRHADFTFHEEVSGRRSGRVPNGATLQVTAKYHLEVAVRTTRTGIPAAGEAQPIQEPGRQKDVKILVVADSPGGGFEIPEPVQYLALPPNGDSRQNAWFKGVRAVRATGYASELLQIRVRLYYNLNLIEVAIIEAEAVTLFQPTQESRLGLEKPIRFHQELRERDYGNVELIQPRGMHILVGARSGGVDLSFVLEREGRADTVLSGTARVPEDSLEDSLYAIRRALLKMTTLGDFSGSSKDDAAFIASMRGLAELGRALWTRLFELESESALFHIGEWLWEHPLPASSMIQVSAESGAFAFVLPWNLLYDRDLPADKDALPDPEGFWGVRYQIEQRAATSDATDESTHPVEPVELGYLTWPFAETPLQGAFLQDMAQRSQGRMSTIRVIDSAKEAMAYLTAGASHIVCFFAHGHTQFRGAERVGFSESDFVKLYQDLPAGSPLHDAWRDFHEEIQQRRYESDRSWIMLHTGRIYLSQLYQIKGLCFAKKPVVLLNMCESAQLTPSLRESFIHFFLDRGAAAVVGTECSMCPQFAHLFAKELLAGLLAGEALGKVMVEARTKFLNQRNPLGLAYTLFGSPTARFQPALVDRSAEAPGSAAAPSSPASD